MWVVNEQLRHNECPIVDVWLVDIVPLYCFSRFLLLLYDNLLDVFNIEPCIFIKISWNLVSQMVHINMAFLQTIQCQNIVETFPLIHQIVHFKNHQIVHFRNYYIHNQWCIKASLNLTYFLWRKIYCIIVIWESLQEMHLHISCFHFLWSREENSTLNEIYALQDLLNIQFYWNVSMNEGS